MRAPRADGRGPRSSRTSAPAPSVMTKPSRRTSKGRDIPERRQGGHVGEGGDADPGHGRPRRRRRWPRRTGPRPPAGRRRRCAWVPAAQAVVMVSHGPCQPSADGDGGGTGVGHHHGDEEGRDPPRALLAEDERSAPRGSRGRRRRCRRRRRSDPGSAPISPASLEGHVGRGHRELGEAVDAGGPPWGRTSRSGSKSRHPALALGRRAVEAVPEGVEADPAARDDADAGDGDPPPGDGPVGADAQQHQSLAEIRS